MVCIQCGSQTNVTNSRLQKRLNQVWRRRHCFSCQATFTTIEAADLPTSWLVKDSAGNITAFSRDKLFLSLFKSTEHRKQAVNDASALTATIIAKLTLHATNGLIEGTTIVSVALVALNRFDAVASSQYRAYHPLTKA